MSEGSGGSKKQIMSAAEAARLLRDLADKLEQGTLCVGEHRTAPGEELQVKVSGKSKERSASLALKLKWDDCGGERSEEAVTDGERIPSYKSIKKRLSASFKQIRSRLGEGGLPSLELAERFDRDVALMLHYPKKGERADIAAFREISATFTAAVRAGDLDAALREAAALAATEKSCHKQYK